MSYRSLAKSILILIPFLAILLLCFRMKGNETAETSRQNSAEISKEDSKNENDKKSSSTQEEKGPATPSFSAESGFYEESFSLTMEAEEGSKIYYTTDSSTPTTSSAVYEGQIQIYDPSAQENVLTNNPNFWPYRVLPAQEGEPEILPGYYTRYERTLNPQDKCMVIRAIAVDKDGNCSAVKTASYFIGFQNKSGYDNIPILSIVSDPDGLVGDENGIMVNGTGYVEKLLSGGLDGIDNTKIIRYYCNSYIGRGREWEREIHMDYFSEKGEKLIFSQEAGIRLHGNQSRIAVPQKSFNLYARKDYDGNKTFKYSFFESGVLSDTVTLMRSSDLRNYYLSEKVNHRTMDTQDYQMVQLFLDGEYWGMYAIQERYNSNTYMTSHYGYKKDDYKLYAGKPEGYELKNGNEKTTLTSFRILKDFVANTDLSDPVQYKKLLSMMDIQSFIDNYATRLYIADQDWNWFKNTFLMYSEGKWHWIIYDTDYGVASHVQSTADINTFTSTRARPDYSLENDPFFPYLMKNDDFRRDFVNTFMDLSNGVFDSASVQEDCQEFLEKYGVAGEKTIERYPAIPREDIDPKGSDGASDLGSDGGSDLGFEGGSDYGSDGGSDYGADSVRDNATDYSIDVNDYYRHEWEEITDFFERRPSYTIPYLKEYFSLSGNLSKITLQVNDSEGGNIKINTIKADLSTKNCWSGQYFSDYPVTLTAQAKNGWKFAGWQSDDGSITEVSKSKALLSFKGDVSVTAVFEKKNKKN